MLKYLKRGPGFYGYLWRLTGPIALQNPWASSTR